MGLDKRGVKVVHAGLATNLSARAAVIKEPLPKTSARDTEYRILIPKRAGTWKTYLGNLQQAPRSVVQLKIPVAGRARLLYHVKAAQKDNAAMYDRAWRRFELLCAAYL